MIGHQTIRPTNDAMFAPLFGERMFVKFEIVVPEEDVFAPIAALRDMVRNARNDEACDAGHGRLSRERLAESRHSVMVAVIPP